MIELPVLEKLRDSGATCDEDAREILLCFHCPGCNGGHSYRIKGAPGQPVWEWNGSMTSPTFQPSLLVNGDWPQRRCHLFLREGSLEFLQDCHHDLRGTTIKLLGIV